MTALDLTNSYNTTPAPATTPGTRCTDIKGWSRIVCEHLATYWRPMRCRRCMGCLRWKTNRVISQVLGGLDGEDKWKSFITLTSTPGMEWSSLMRAFQRLVKWLRTTYGNVQYAAVKQEGSLNGMRHLHVLFLGLRWVPYAALSARWRSLTGAWSVDIQRIAGAKVAGYISRYIGQGMGVLLGKAVTFSKGWRRVKPPEKVEYNPDIGKPHPRPWVAMTKAGTLIECWGPDGECVCPGRR